MNKINILYKPTFYIMYDPTIPPKVNNSDRIVVGVTIHLRFYMSVVRVADFVQREYSTCIFIERLSSVSFSVSLNALPCAFYIPLTQGSNRSVIYL